MRASRVRVAAAAGVLVLVAWAGLAAAAGGWGWLGVRIRDLSEQEMEEISKRHGIREGFGAMIVEVIPDTPAEGAGLRSGDLVVAVGDRPVVDTRALQRFVASAGVGETVALTVLRRDEGRRRLIPVRLAPMPEAVAAERIAAEFGFLVREPEARGELGGLRSSVPPSVTGVLPRSRAAAAGMKVGDVLVEVNGRPVLTLQAVREALLAVSAESPLPLVLRRAGRHLSIVLDGALGAP
ncbi:MAG: PDZ domain-containing protein [Candidatus Rokubacteria bacterium]|nr:PDZ domain-containing protein [Candidatus Rokubacteria bacterium]